MPVTDIDATGPIVKRVVGSMPAEYDPPRGVFPRRHSQLVVLHRSNQNSAPALKLTLMDTGKFPPALPLD